MKEESTHPGQGRINSSRNYLDFEFKQFDSTQGYVDRYVNDERANPFLQPYRTPGGNTTSQPSRKRNLVQTMVNWIRHRADEPHPVDSSTSRAENEQAQGRFFATLYLPNEELRICATQNLSSDEPHEPLSDSSAFLR